MCILALYMAIVAAALLCVTGYAELRYTRKHFGHRIKVLTLRERLCKLFGAVTDRKRLPFFRKHCMSNIVVYCASKVFNDSAYGKSSVTSGVDDMGVTTFEICLNMGRTSPRETRETLKVPQHLMQEFLEQVTKATAESHAIVLSK